MRGTTQTNIALLIGAKEVHGKKATLETLRDNLAGVPLAIASSILCYVGAHWEGDSAADWMALDQGQFQPFILSPGTQRAVARYAARQQREIVVITRRRALALLRLSHAICLGIPGQKLTEEVSQQGRYAIGEAFLQIGDLLEDRTEEQLEDALGIMAGAFEESNRPSFMLACSRVYGMIRQPSWSVEPILIDAENRFNGHFGLSIREYMYVVVGFISKMMVRQGDLGHGMFKLTDALSRARDRDAIKKVVEELSIPFANARVEIGTDLDGILKSRSQEPFRSRPLLAFWRDQIFWCTDFYGMAEQLWSGLYWKIFRLFSTDGERNQFSAAWGKLFEEPVALRIEAAIKVGLKGMPLKPRFFRSPPDGGGGELADALIVCGSSAVLIECKAIVLTEKAKYSGDSKILIDEARRKILKDSSNGVQLVRSLQRLFGNSALAAKYFGRHKTATIYPVIVSLDQSITLPGIGPSLDELFRDQLRDVVPTGVSVMPLSLLNADDVDSMATVISAGKKPHTIFRDRFEVDPKGQNTFHNHLYDIMTRMGLDSPLVPSEFHDLFGDTISYWASQGEPHVFPQ